MTRAKEQILKKLQVLMTKQSPSQDNFSGIPFVSSETTFGITTGLKARDLYAMHHLIDSLNQSNFFGAEQASKTYCDTMPSEFDLGETKSIYSYSHKHLRMLFYDL